MKIGLIINPIAGVGGKAGLKGSDGVDIQEMALEKGGTLESANKTKIALKEIMSHKEEIEFLSAPGKMGEELLEELAFNYTVVGNKKETTTAEDTEEIANQMKEESVDLIIFSGGDGTARNIYNAVELNVPVIGVPTGVKIHSAVYANNPTSAGKVIDEYIVNRDLAQLSDKEVMDLDEDKFRDNIVEAKLYGYLNVPHIEALMQGSKDSTSPSTADIEGMSDEVEDKMEKKPADTCYVFGTGGTTYKILEDLGYEGSLLGVDVIKNNKIILKDASENELYDLLKDEENIVLIVTAIGGQGHIFGRGNQQISPRIIRLVPKDDLWIVATSDKLFNLDNKALLVDTSDPELDKELEGYKRVITAWKETTMFKIKA